MIPLKDDVPSRSLPVVNTVIIVLNVLAFLYQFSLGGAVDAFVQRFGVIPIRYFYEGMQSPDGTVAYFTLAERIYPLFTSMFLHGGWLHLIGNMLYLWIFGDNVEDRMGHGRYAFFYILCGLIAAGVHVATNQDSPVPTVGASGAIAGVLGAYMLLYPRARVLVVIPIFVFAEMVRLPALLVLGFWFVMQLFQGTLSLAASSTATGGVAWWAHIGGFVAGMLLLLLFKKRQYIPPEHDPLRLH
jgi:membrane associated rhomboid family serine protease